MQLSNVQLIGFVCNMKRITYLLLWPWKRCINPYFCTNGAVNFFLFQLFNCVHGRAFKHISGYWPLPLPLRTFTLRGFREIGLV